MLVENYKTVYSTTRLIAFTYKPNRHSRNQGCSDQHALCAARLKYQLDHRSIGSPAHSYCPQWDTVCWMPPAYRLDFSNWQQVKVSFRFSLGMLNPECSWSLGAFRACADMQTTHEILRHRSCFSTLCWHSAHLQWHCNALNLIARMLRSLHHRMWFLKDQWGITWSFFSSSPNHNHSLSPHCKPA